MSVEREDTKSRQEQEQTLEQQQTGVTTPGFAPGEETLQGIQFGQLGVTDPISRALTQGLGNILGPLLSGGDLPGFLSNLPGGISPELTGEIAGKAVEDIRPSFQGAGILDSGIALELATGEAGNIRRRSAEFNINNLFNLLNLGITGATATQQGFLGQQQLLSQRLAGLRPVTSTSALDQRGFGTTTGETTGTRFGAKGQFGFTKGPFQFGVGG